MTKKYEQWKPNPEHHKYKLEKCKNAGRSIQQNLKGKTQDELANYLPTGEVVQCKECGYIATRLQWSHFRYKCTGRFQNGKEYKAHYNLPTVAPKLAKLIAVTEQSLIELYGEQEGKKRWNDYLTIQKESNQLEYKKQVHGWTKDDYRSYNLKRASTKENFISRHGEVKGLQMWEDYCARQAETCSVEYFKEKYGEEDGNQRFQTWRDNWASSSSNPSKFEIECCNALDEMLGQQQRQICLKYNNGKNRYMYDYGNRDRKKLIEMHGTYWHGHPLLFEDDKAVIRDQMTVKQVRARDLHKQITAFKNGYDVFYIWEHEWHETQQDLLEEVQEFWESS